MTQIRYGCGWREERFRYWRAELLIGEKQWITNAQTVGLITIAHAFAVRNIGIHVGLWPHC